MATSLSPVQGMRKVVQQAKHLVAEVLYERRYGVTTSAKVVLDGHDEENVSYVPMNWRQLKWALPVRSVSRDDVFIDIGSGKGRAVLVAAVNYPFGRVIGVELAKELHETAQANMAASANKVRAGKVELICADVREYEIPDDVTVIYMNNPVRGSIFGGLLDSISASQKRNPRRMRVIYYNPVEEEALLATGQWRKVRTIARRRAQANWPFGVTAIYEWSATAA
jgi:SAM-dependent methyltransferase